MAPHPSETAIATLRRKLHALDGDGPIVPRRHLMPGFWIAADDRGAVQMQFSANPGSGVRIDMQVQRPGRWLSLNLALDKAPLSPGDMLGLVLELHSDAAFELPCTVRSGLPEGAVDTAFPAPLALGPQRDTHAALLPVEADSAVTQPAAWRNLMLQLPVGRLPERLCLTLVDLRLFVAPSPEAPAPPPPPPDRTEAA